MQPALREERPPSVTIWRGIVRNEPKTNRVELWQRASSGETAAESVCLHACVCLTAEKGTLKAWATKTEQKRLNKNYLKLLQKPSNGDSRWADDGMNEWVETGEDLTPQLRVEVQDVWQQFVIFQLRCEKKEAKGRWGVAPVNSEDRVWRVPEIFGISGTTDSGRSNKLFQPFEKPRSLFIEGAAHTFAAHNEKNPQRLQSHLMSSLLTTPTISNFTDKTIKELTSLLLSDSEKQSEPLASKLWLSLLGLNLNSCIATTHSRLVLFWLLWCMLSFWKNKTKGIWKAH